MHEVNYNESQRELNQRALVEEYLHAYFFEKIGEQKEELNSLCLEWLAESQIDYSKVRTSIADHSKIDAKIDMLAQWDGYRSANWDEIIEFPEHTLAQTQEILSFAK